MAEKDTLNVAGVGWPAYFSGSAAPVSRDTVSHSPTRKPSTVTTVTSDVSGVHDIELPWLAHFDHI